jgi:hypothetical protein
MFGALAALPRRPAATAPMNIVEAIDDAIARAEATECGALLDVGKLFDSIRAAELLIKLCR